MSFDPKNWIFCIIIWLWTLDFPLIPSKVAALCFWKRQKHACNTISGSGDLEGYYERKSARVGGVSGFCHDFLVVSVPQNRSTSSGRVSGGLGRYIYDILVTGEKGSPRRTNISPKWVRNCPGVSLLWAVSGARTGIQNRGKYHRLQGPKKKNKQINSPTRPRTSRGGA